MSGDLARILSIVAELREEHNSILSSIGNARSRVVTVESLYEQMAGLSTAQQDFMRSALSCAEHGLYRPAVVMAWCSVFDKVLDVAATDEFRKIRAVRSKWSFTQTREGLAEAINEYQVIDACRDAGLITKTLAKTLHGQLHTRNQAAHPTGYVPTLNRTLGYLEDAIVVLSDLGN